MRNDGGRALGTERRGRGERGERWKRCGKLGWGFGEVREVGSVVRWMRGEGGIRDEGWERKERRETGSSWVD